MSVSWIKDEITAEAFNLLNQWAEIKFDDAIFLLSRNFTANNIYSEASKSGSMREINLRIREYAVGVLKKIEIEMLSKSFHSPSGFIVLQLVSALRYEILEINRSPLVDFLLEKAAIDTQLAIMIYWHIVVETESKNQTIKKWYITIKDTLMEGLQARSASTHEMLVKQSNYKEKLNAVTNFVLKKEKTNERRKGLIRKVLKGEDGNGIPEIEGGREGLSILNPDIKVTSVIAEQASIFKSNTAPVLLAYNSMRSNNLKRLHSLILTALSTR